jgi:hypothetical protein
MFVTSRLPTRRDLARFAALAVIAVSVSGCTAARSSQPPLTSSVQTQITLPLNAFRLSDEEQKLVLAARKALMIRCMRTAGYPDVTVQLPTPSGTDLVSFANQRRYGALDQPTASRWGYHLPRDTKAVDQYAMIERWKRALPRRALLALEGADGSGGCHGAATRALAKGVRQGDGGLVTRLDFESLERSRSHPRVVHTLRDWETCVAGYGLHYADPDAAVSDPSWRLDSPRAAAAEIYVARVDVECKARTRLVQTWVSVETQLQRRLIDASASEFRRIDSAKHAYLANARRALATP